MKLEQLIGEATEYDKKAMLEIKKPKSWLKSVVLLLMALVVC